MCLSIATNLKYEEAVESLKKIANEDIKVYKKFERKGIPFFRKYISPFMWFKYKLGKKYFSDFSFVYSENSWGNYLHVEAGLHAYYKKDSYYLSSNQVVIECIIPIGSIYYSNEYGEIVSNSLIIGKKCQKKKK